MSENMPEKRKYGVPEFRDKIIRRLETAYAENKLELEEYEKRLDLANRAEFIEDLEVLVRDFPEHQRPNISGISGIDELGEPRDDIPEGDADTKIALLGDQHLTAEDFYRKEIRSVSIIGDVNIDIRRFRNSEEPVRIKVYSLIGDTRIIIPRGMKVRNRLFSLLGDYELLRNERENDREEIIPEAPGTCVLEGFSLLGDISIQEEGSRKKGFLRNFFKRWRDRL